MEKLNYQVLGKIRLSRVYTKRSAGESAAVWGRKFFKSICGLFL